MIVVCLVAIGGLTAFLIWGPTTLPKGIKITLGCSVNSGILLIGALFLWIRGHRSPETRSLEVPSGSTSSDTVRAITASLTHKPLANGAAVATQSPISSEQVLKNLIEKLIEISVDALEIEESDLTRNDLIHSKKAEVITKCKDENGKQIYLIKLIQEGAQRTTCYYQLKPEEQMIQVKKYSETLTSEEVGEFSLEGWESCSLFKELEKIFKREGSLKLACKFSFD